MEEGLPPTALHGFPRIRGPFLVVLIIRALLFWGPYWSPSTFKAFNMAVSENWGRGSGVLFWGPYNKSPTISPLAWLGSIKAPGVWKPPDENQDKSQSRLCQSQGGGVTCTLRVADCCSTRLFNDPWEKHFFGLMVIQ